MDALFKLEAIEKIRNLKGKYFRCMDCKLWGELSSVFTKDMKVLTESGKVYVEGGGSFADALQESLTTAISCHQGFTAEIEIVDDKNAKAVWAMQDVIEWDDRHPRQGWKSILGRGHYHETYCWEDGEWRIATMMLTRLRLDIVWPDDAQR